MLTEKEATKEKAEELEVTVVGASGRGEPHERAEAEALCMEQTVTQVQGKAKANKGPETKNSGVEVTAEAEEPQVGLGAAEEVTEVTRLEVAGGSKVVHWCSLDVKEGTQALQRVQSQVLQQKVSSRAQTVQAEEERRAIVHKVHRQVQQQVGAKA